MDWAARGIEYLWIGGLAGIPVALLAAGCCRWRGCRPATRHALWLAVLLSFAMPAFTAGLWRPSWFRSERVLAAADSVSRRITDIVSAPTRELSDPAPAAPARIVEILPEPLHAAQEPAPAPNAPVANPKPSRASNKPASVGHRRPAVSAPRIERPALTPPAPAPATPTIAEKPASGGPTALPLMMRVITDVVAQAQRASAHRAELSHVEPAAVAQQPEGATGQVRAWAGQVLALRDAVAALPPLPPSIWLGGAMLVAIACAVRTVMVQRLVARGTPAPPPLASMVARLSRVAGLKRAPTTLVVPDRISPMIWCGIRPRLVLPLSLWQQLDAKGQRAVVVHELSHLKRGDHRLCWLEALIGIVYWWHPVAWWARRRLRDEAEASCDAWVTTLMPGRRRAYAEALVTTRSFLSVPGHSGAPGLGVMSGRTRQLARRLTMVMTQRTAPRSSLAGVALAMGIALAGAFVMPGLACPPEDEKVKAKATEAKAKDAQARAKAAEKAARAQAEAAQKSARSQAQAAQQQARDQARAAQAQARSAQNAARAHAQAAEKAAQAHAHAAEHAAKEHGAKAEKAAKDYATKADKASKDQAAKEKAAKAKKEGVEFLGEAPALDAMRKQRQAGQRDVESLMEALRQKERALQEMENRLKDMQKQLEQLQRQPRTPRPPREQTSGRPGTAPLAAVVGVPTPRPSATTVLGGGQRPGAVTLMPQARTATLYGAAPSTPAPRAVAQPGAEEARSYVLPEGKLEALVDLMARDDVPILIERADGKIVVHGTAQQHKIFEAFVQLIHPGSAGSGPRTAPSPYLSLSTPDLIRNADPVLADRYVTTLNPNQLRASLVDLAVLRQNTGKASDQLREQIEALHEQAEELRGKAKQEEEDGEGSVSSGTALLQSLLTQLNGADARLESLDGLAESLDGQLESLQDALESMDLTTNPEGPEAPACPEAAECPSTAACPASAACSTTPATPATPAAAATPARPATPASPAKPAAPAAPATPAAPPGPASAR